MLEFILPLFVGIKFIPKRSKQYRCILLQSCAEGIGAENGVVINYEIQESVGMTN